MDCLAKDPCFPEHWPFLLGSTKFCFKMRITIWTILFFFLNSQVESAELRRPREPLSDISSAQIILVEVHGLTPQAVAAPSSMERIVTKRMEELGYTVETDQFSPHDVVVQVAHPH